ncbi:MAG: DUF4390 domain-containing protein [Deltaproteobacteria bacterium]|nr:DUF4390 domain-containing protein [Deltaproteobacteria bacterium]MBW1817568.1 DUF4390 domain-containing protein [Deltaproteobacteria bacterium]
MKLKSIFILFLFISVAHVSHARGEETTLTEIMVSTTQGHLSVSFKVSNCFTEDMKAAIENGIRTTFTFFVDLDETRDFWWDRGITNVKVSHDIHYDSLKKVYTIVMSEQSGRPVVVSDFEKAKEAMSRISDLKVADLSTLTKGKRYQVRMMAELDKIRLPFYLHYVFFFLSLWDFKTDWYAVDFIF